MFYNVINKKSSDMKDQVMRILTDVMHHQKTRTEATNELFVLFGVSISEANVCPECNYPKIKKTFEDFERCEGCNWTSK